MTESEKESILDIIEVYSVMCDFIVYFRPKNCMSALLITAKNGNLKLDVKATAFLDPVSYELEYTIEADVYGIPHKIRQTNSYSDCIKQIPDIFGDVENYFIKIK
jgi:hypothetical protein